MEEAIWRGLGWDGADALEEEEERVVRLWMDGREVEVGLGAGFVRYALLPAVRLIEKLLQASPRVICGVCGPPGIGKSTMAALLQRVFAEKHSCVLGMDAYHFPSRTLKEKRLEYQGEQKPLIELKGLPPTIDVSTFLNDLAMLHENKGDVSLPVYDRTLHEPTPDAFVVPTSSPVVIVEGIHLFNSEPDWAQVRSHLDAWILLAASSFDVCRTRLLARKARAGLSAEEALRHIESIDYANFKQISAQLEEARSYPERAPVLYIANQAALSISRVAPDFDPPRSQSSVAKSVAVLGPNPALQKTLHFSPGWQPGEVNRAESVSLGAGGKGQQFCKAMSSSRHTQMSCIHTTLFQFLGGETGKFVASQLHELAGIELKTIFVPHETRTCTAAIDDQGLSTEFIEPAKQVPGHCCLEMAQAFESFLGKSGRCSMVALCGTTPPGAPDLYERFAEIAKANDVPILLDAYVGVEKVLPFVNILKVNAREIRAIAKQGGDVFGSAKTILGRHPAIQWILVTGGAGVSYAFPQGTQSWYELRYGTKIPLSELRNTTGAGDVVSASFVTASLSGKSVIDSFAYALAAGSASCLEVDGGLYSAANLQRFQADISVSLVRQEPAI